MCTGLAYKKMSSMTSMLYFDTDCFSSFLSVNQEGILFRLYPGRMLLPKQVYDELCNPCVPHFKRKINRLCASGSLSTKEILIDTEEYRLYYELAISPPRDRKIIGKGEAAAIALAKTYNGILASNNLKDITSYVDKYRLKHLTTGGILVAAKDTGCIDEAKGNKIWCDMIDRNRMLPADSFTDYLKMTKW